MAFSWCCRACSPTGTTGRSTGVHRAGGGLWSVWMWPAGRSGRFETAFVHFRPNSWNTRDRTAREVLEARRGPHSHIGLAYDEPWFWFTSALQEADEAPRMPRRAVVELEALVVWYRLRWRASLWQDGESYALQRPKWGCETSQEEMEPERDVQLGNTM